MDSDSPLDEDFEPRAGSSDSMFDSPQLSPYCPGLILQPDEDPSSYNYVSAPDIGVDIPQDDFDMSSLSPPQGEIRLLESFREVKMGKLVQVKRKKYLFQHLKALRKSFKQHSLDRFPTKSLHRVSSEGQRTLWKVLRTVYSTHLQELQPTSIPLADVQHPNLRERILTNFFSSAARRTYNFLFCELIFESSSLELCAKSGMQCCSGPHTTTCDLHWSQLKHYTQIGLLKELGLEVSDAEEMEWKETLRAISS